MIAKPGRPAKDAPPKMGWKSNTQGLRDKDYPPRPAKGVVRVLVIGPMEFNRPNEPLELTAVKRFERQLNEENTGTRYEVINGSLWNYSLLEYSIKLGDLLAAYHPHFVVYAMGRQSTAKDYAFFEDLRYNETKRPVLLEQDPFRWLRGLPKLAAALQGTKSLNFFAFTFREQWMRMRRFRTLGGKPGNAEAAQRFLEPTIRLGDWMQQEARTAGSDFCLLFPANGIDNNQTPAPWASRAVIALFRPLIPEFSLQHPDVAGALQAAKFRFFHYRMPYVGPVPDTVRDSPEGTELQAKGLLNAFYRCMVSSEPGLNRR